MESEGFWVLDFEADFEVLEAFDLVEHWPGFLHPLKVHHCLVSH